MRHLAGLFICIMIAGAARVNAQDPPPRSVRSWSISARRFRCFPTTRRSWRRAAPCKSPSFPAGASAAQIGVHFYLLRWRALTVGVGGEAIIARASSTPAPETELRAVDEQLVSAAPQLSFNFGSGNGWSYLSGGVGRSVWSLHEAGLVASDADVEPLQTINYGGGARWFIKDHLAFSLDVRFYEIAPGTPIFPTPGSPRTRLLIIGAGISLK